MPMMMAIGVYSAGMILLSLLIRLLNLYSYVFVADALLSWFLRPDSRIRRILIFLTEPLVSLFRPLEDRIRRNSNFPISLAHLFAFVFLQIVIRVLSYVINLL